MTNRVRLAVLDDGLFVRTPGGSVHPTAATFHRFVETVAREGRFAAARYVVPIRHLGPGDTPPALPAVDRELLDIVPTAPFAGIADYVLRLGVVSARNWPIIRRAVSASDLVWLRLPASNALLTLAACRLTGVPCFGWLAGSVSEVVAGQPRSRLTAGPAGLLARAYDAVSTLAAREGPLIRLDSDMSTSVVTMEDIATLANRPERGRSDGRSRIVWAGRMAPEKGLPDLIRAAQLLLEDGLDVELSFIGDGPVRHEIEDAAVGLGSGRAQFHGYVGDRTRYLELLAEGDVLVHPSRAEGLPKVIVEAMAVGVPVVATAVGTVPDLLAGGERGRLVPPAQPDALRQAIADLLADGRARERLARAGQAYAADHTAEAQARRLLAWMRERFPHVAWDAS